ncbi:RNA polymerase sigma factor [Pontimicrobium aquaticum]|uniref:RNA polymerase sigma-70 factor n=1 Tax=Pontimicrobium aquaticum TaxID=2565367 RepID=A0A4U0ERB4_9FLAO|nr:RNA polymerase sigma-70 factor [Pontimicrobium aquaticum]TJY32842.1 RNA polymerase sigma-70 factor [Pontimicrobium aquaticum]
MNDKVLWKQIQNRDSLSFKKVFELYYEPLYSYIAQFTNDKSKAEDIVQNTFVTLWIKRESITINTSLKAYLFKSAYNKYCDIYRKQKKNDKLLEDLKYESFISQIEVDDNLLNQKKQRIKALVDKLPKRCKEILLLSKQEILKQKEIAKRLNISIKTVEAQLRIAFKKIRKDF